MSAPALIAVPTAAPERVPTPYPGLQLLPQPGAAVTVVLLNDKSRRGTLQSIDMVKGEIAFTPPEGAIEKVSLADLRYLWCVDSSRPPRAEGSGHGGAPAAAPSSQRFTIRFTDGKELSGQASRFETSEYGLHLTRVTGADAALRVFVPTHAVASKQIGSELAASLVEANVVLPGALDRARARAVASRKQIGVYLHEGTAVPRRAIDEVLAEQSGAQGHRLGEMLVAQSLVTRQQLNEALSRQARDHETTLGEALVELGAINAETYQEKLAENLGMRFVRLRRFKPTPEALQLVEREFAQRRALVPLMIEEDRLVVGMSNPLDAESVSLLRFMSGRNVDVVVCTAEDVTEAIRGAYGPSTASNDVMASLNLDAKGEAVAGERAAAEQLAGEKPLVKLVSEMFTEAIARKASDIHIRPSSKHIDVLFRVHGGLVQWQRMPIALLSAIVSRIKIMGTMNIAEKRLPQDGQTRIALSDRTIDVRISVIPTIFGESVVMRILDTSAGLKSLSEIGFGPRDLAVMNDVLTKSFGMVLVTGPTGSGKSTTLYAALKEVSKQNVNIITVENPVEYHIEGIMQVQVHPEIGYTFAETLRHILRHDPDVILVGEIRDQETAQIAVRSALTGHLVLSTLHTNNAAGAIGRLVDMGTESFMLTSTLLAVLAQRLVRRNCDQCLVPEEVPPVMRQAVGASASEPFFTGRGCDQCNDSGYSGRIAVYELLVMTPAVQALVRRGAASEEIHRQAVADGMVPLTVNALERARAKDVSLSEVYRTRLE